MTTQDDEITRGAEMLRQGIEVHGSITGRWPGKPLVALTSDQWEMLQNLITDELDAARSSLNGTDNVDEYEFALHRIQELDELNEALSKELSR